MYHHGESLRGELLEQMQVDGLNIVTVDENQEVVEGVGGEREEVIGGGEALERVRRKRRKLFAELEYRIAPGEHGYPHESNPFKR